MSLIGKLFRAAMLRPWELDEDDDFEPEEFEIINGGAPHHREFRMSEDGFTAAVWVPSANTWLVFQNVTTIKQYQTPDPGSLRDWRRFLEVEEVD